MSESPSEFKIGFIIYTDDYEDIEDIRNHLEDEGYNFWEGEMPR